MIAYQITQADLEIQIEQESPGWLQKAAARTAGFRKKGAYEEKSSIWSEVKSVYMRLQGDCKCAYCERKLESVAIGKVEQDVEHFRPKGGVREWKLPKSLKDQGILATAVPDEDRGYYLLPYHPFNYSATCKPCNSALKKDYFPIAGRYNLAGDDPAKLTREEPFLICPIGDFDDDPEDLIRFHGVSPQATASSGFRRERALVTIEFFKLDDAAKRKNLLLERARLIVALFPQLEKSADSHDASIKAKARALVAAFTAQSAPHTNCSRSFKMLFEANRAAAERIFDEASGLITTIS